MTRRSRLPYAGAVAPPRILLLMAAKTYRAVSVGH